MAAYQKIGIVFMEFIMNYNTLLSRLHDAEEDYYFYKSVGDFGMADQSLDRWQYLNTLVEGARNVA